VTSEGTAQHTTKYIETYLRYCEGAALPYLDGQSLKKDRRSWGLPGIDPCNSKAEGCPPVLVACRYQALLVGIDSLFFHICGQSGQVNSSHERAMVGSILKFACKSKRGSEQKLEFAVLRYYNLHLLRPGLHYECLTLSKDCKER
jgi:hypothetical protein